MTAIVWTDVTAQPGAAALSLSTVSSTAQTVLLAAANKYFDITSFDGEEGPDTRLARIYLVMHFVYLDRQGVGGALTLETDGRLSRQYAIPNTRTMFFQTAYGTLIWQLMGVRARLPVLL